MAGLGLAGLWMMHTLAQDFQSIMKNGFGSATNLLGAGSRGEEQTYTNSKINLLQTQIKYLYISYKIFR